MQKYALANTTVKTEKLYMLSNMQTKLCTVPLNALSLATVEGLGGCFVCFVGDGFLSKAFAVETNM